MAGRPGGTGGEPARYQQHKIGSALFDLKNDIGEAVDVASRHPAVVARLELFARAARDDLGDQLHKLTGKGRRPAGKLGPDDERLKW